MVRSRVRKIFTLLLIAALILPGIPLIMAALQTQNQLENLENQMIVGALTLAFNVQPVKSEGDAHNWTIQTVDSIGDVGLANSLAFDPSGNPAISYGDVNNYDLKYAHWNGHAWDVEIVDSSGDQDPVLFYPQTSLAFDALGNPAISYYNGYPYYDLKYAHWNGTGWDMQVVFDDGGGAGWTRTTSLAFDGGGNPAIAFRYPTVGLEYAHWNGAGWSIETVDGGYGTGAACCLRFDHLGNPAVAYHWQGVYQGPSGIRYAYFNGTTWSVEVLYESPAAYYPSLAFDSSGNPAISYYDYSNKTLFYAHWNVTGWSTQIVNVEPLSSPSLAFDHVGNPAMSYYDEANLDLKYAYFNGSNWNIETVDSQGDVGQVSSLAFDSSGNPAISYYDGTNGDLKLAYKLPITPGTPPDIRPYILLLVLYLLTRSWFNPLIYLVLVPIAVVVAIIIRGIRRRRGKEAPEEKVKPVKPPKRWGVPQPYEIPREEVTAHVMSEEEVLKKGPMGVGTKIDHEKLGMLLYQRAMLKREENGGIMTYGEAYLMANTGKLAGKLGTGDVENAVKILVKNKFIPGVRELKSGVRVISFFPVEFTDDQNEVLSIASRSGFTTLEEVMLETGWTRVRTQNALQALEQEGIARRDESYAKGKKYYFPGLIH